MTSPAGPRLALLLPDGFERLVALVTEELARRGHPGVTATHEFALSAVDDGAGSTSELAARLGVTKQAAAKTVAALEQMGYLRRAADPRDARRRQLTVTPRGHEMTRLGAAEFDRLRDEWIATVGPRAAAAAETALDALTRVH